MPSSLGELEVPLRVGDGQLIAGWVELGCRTQKRVTAQGLGNKTAVAPDAVPSGLRGRGRGQFLWFLLKEDGG